MSVELFVTVIGNLTQDPELRKTPTGKRVTTVTVAQNPRFFDSATGEWKDGDPVFVRCNVWDDMAEHVVTSLARGMRVVAYGQLKQHSWETPEGERRWSQELLVNSIGPDLRYAVADVTKVERRAIDPRTPADTAAAPSAGDDATDRELAPADSRDKVPF
ncbi:single-stranded DNA-binding protein [Nocardia terpenica]|uniref:single-stranded DNA-binding protein n=1 Tax=Nocardia terpenica TaxID=455432 RepID=UPI001893CA91|nr:single-stranded DNA-binding protein [Nocardia terpenica]MBF6062039.1 single-stranded DNA-binding protein [Nocardia terpenica]MBF6106161.1 single-stranded DNA-binding protein [Nocardia terpenica]MBF6110459.1 single-stranded DNA-binding protein [Nocardia terpenica]MBF6120704.1 single-stranded DNA-binding protein [Nocardia terpenica]MBF6151795.1 single-stranded DNA-binding protein [Nocardia terpenica]